MDQKPLSAGQETTGYGALLRHWRALRRHSQLSLSLAADISARHLSFLESGRARPSREMVLRLADALAMPRDAANQALNVAGFASIFPALDAAAPELAPVRRATEMMLARHDPYPGFVIDRYWNVLGANKAALFLFSTLTLPEGVAPNLIDALILAEGTGLMENWSEVARLGVARLQAEEIALGGDGLLAEKIKTLQDLLRDCGEAVECSYETQRAVIPTVFRINGTRLTLFSTIAAFSTVQDVNAGDIRIELMFPEDEVTVAFFEALSF